MPGTLYVVATPIGNLEDITMRALRILREVDLIACEDTRQTRKLLIHHGIDKPLLSCHEHNEAQRAPELIARLAAGASIALVSDAGTPLLSDPGFRLIRAAIEASIPVVPLPGPSAALAALSAGGLAPDAFLFAGFAPARASQRRKSLERWRDLPATLVFYEAPHRIREFLDDLLAVLGDRPIVLAREITKFHEEFLRGAASEVSAALAARPPLKGEITILVGRAAEVQPPPAGDDALRAVLEDCLRQGMPRMEAIKTVAKRFNLPKREVYKQVG